MAMGWWGIDVGYSSREKLFVSVFVQALMADKQTVTWVGLVLTNVTRLFGTWTKSFSSACITHCGTAAKNSLFGASVKVYLELRGKFFFFFEFSWGQANGQLSVSEC